MSEDNNTRILRNALDVSTKKAKGRGFDLSVFAKDGKIYSIARSIRGTIGSCIIYLDGRDRSVKENQNPKP